MSLQVVTRLSQRQPETRPKNVLGETKGLKGKANADDPVLQAPMSLGTRRGQNELVKGGSQKKFPMTETHVARGAGHVRPSKTCLMTTALSEKQRALRGINAAVF